MRVKDKDHKGIFISHDTYFQLMLLEREKPGCLHLYISLKYYAGVGRDYAFDAKCPGKLKHLADAGLITIKAREITINSVGEEPQEKKPSYKFQNLPGVVNKDGVRELQRYYSQKLKEYMGVLPESNLMYRYVRKLDSILSLMDEGGKKLFTMDEIKVAIDRTLKVRKIAHLNFLQDDLMDARIKRSGSVYDRGDQKQRKVYNMIGQLVELLAKGGCDLPALVGTQVYDLAAKGFRKITQQDIANLSNSVGLTILKEIQANGKPWQQILADHNIVYEEDAQKSR